MRAIGAGTTGAGAGIVNFESCSCAIPTKLACFDSALLHSVCNIFNVFVLLPLAMMIWFVFLRPTHQRRYRQAISDLPRWELRPQ